MTPSEFQSAAASRLGVRQVEVLQVPMPSGLTMTIAFVVGSRGALATDDPQDELFSPDGVERFAVAWEELGDPVR